MANLLVQTKQACLLLVGFVLILAPCVVRSETVAVIVNKNNPTSNLTLKQVKKISKKITLRWEDGKSIYLFLPDLGSPEKNVILSKIYRANEAELKKFWLGKLFRGKISSLPKTLNSNEELQRFISRFPNAIGFVNASMVDNRVKVLSVDNKLPQDAGYFLAEDRSGNN